MYDLDKNPKGEATECKGNPICNKLGKDASAVLNYRNEKAVIFYERQGKQFDMKVVDKTSKETFAQNGILGNITGIGFYDEDDESSQGFYMTKQHAACKFEVKQSIGVGNGISLYPAHRYPYYCNKATDFLGCTNHHCWTPQFDGWAAAMDSQSSKHSLYVLRGAFRRGADIWQALPVHQPTGHGDRILGSKRADTWQPYLDAAGVSSYKVTHKINNWAFKGDEVRLYDDNPFDGPRPKVFKFDAIFPGTDFAGNIDALWFNNFTNEMFLFKGADFYIFDVPADGDFSQAWTLKGSKKYIGNHFHGFPRNLDAVYFHYTEAYFIAEHWFFRLPIDDKWSIDNSGRSYKAENMHAHMSRAGTYFAGFFRDQCFYREDVADEIEIIEKTGAYPVKPLPTMTNPFPGTTATTKKARTTRKTSPFVPGVGTSGSETDSVTSSDPESSNATKGPKSSSNLTLVLFILVFIASVAGVGAWFYMQHKTSGVRHQRNFKNTVLATGKDARSTFAPERKN
ncbi:hypothetical protein HDE_03155 [Halotydeus destructor]|nr:hypothetical protein HDE_03155 [Halotydeus destructor]